MAVFCSRNGGATTTSENTREAGADFSFPGLQSELSQLIAFISIR
jgi:hypothetical protein